MGVPVALRFSTKVGVLRSNLNFLVVPQRRVMFPLVKDATVETPGLRKVRGARGDYFFT